jgi:septal ring factor EnvC (AmiA/AmiB activator)
MLDEWWARIVDRLDSGPAALHRLPEPVAHVAEALWLQALEEGRRQAAAEISSTTRTAEQQSVTLDARAHVLTLREAELEQRLRERERALQESQDQMMQLMRAVQRDQATIRARDTRVLALEAEIARYRSQLKAVLARVVVQHRILKRRTVTRVAKPTPSKRRTIPKKRSSAKRKPRR